MKTVLEILGSPRAHGNTARILNALQDTAPAGYTAEVIDLSKYNINGCQGCSHCQHDLKTFKCVQHDDVNELLQKIIDADAIIYGTPLYGHSYSGQLKIFLDRHVPLFKFVDNADKSIDEMTILSAIENKPVSLVVSCQGPVENNTELISMQFEKFCESSLARNTGTYVFPFCDPTTKESYYDDETLQTIWSNLARSL